MDNVLLARLFVRNVNLVLNVSVVHKDHYCKDQPAKQNAMTATLIICPFVLLVLRVVLNAPHFQFAHFVQQLTSKMEISAHLDVPLRNI
jgi:hypothetical protein